MPRKDASAEIKLAKVNNTGRQECRYLFRAEEVHRSLQIKQLSRPYANAEVCKCSSDALSNVLGCGICLAMPWQLRESWVGTVDRNQLLSALCLSKYSPNLHNLHAICKLVAKHAMHLQAGTAGKVCSFQRVTCALIHLVTLPVLVSSVLTQLFNPVLSTVADNLDLEAVCQRVLSLASQRSLTDPNYKAFHQVSPCC